MDKSLSTRKMAEYLRNRDNRVWQGVEGYSTLPKVTYEYIEDATDIDVPYSWDSAENGVEGYEYDCTIEVTIESLEGGKFIVVPNYHGCNFNYDDIWKFNSKQGRWEYLSSWL